MHVQNQLKYLALAWAISMMHPSLSVADTLHTDEVLFGFEGMADLFDGAFDTNNDGRVLGEDRATGAVYEYDRDDDEPGVTTKTNVGSTVDGDFDQEDIDFSFENRMSFFHNIQTTLSARDQRDARNNRVGFSMTAEYRNRALDDQSYLANHLRRFKERSISDEPIIAYGLEHARITLTKNQKKRRLIR